VVVPSLKVTEPVGVPDPGVVTATVAVSVMGWPLTSGPAGGLSAVVVEAALTT